jgi:hypothetical protein
MRRRWEKETSYTASGAEGKMSARERKSYAASGAAGKRKKRVIQRTAWRGGYDVDKRKEHTIL